tara:strand:- start:3360 stop:3536 length:177 start_codon:yes stop_codon:yes gene_type:complete
MKSVGLIHILASVFGLVVVTSVLFGFNFIGPVLEYLNTTTGFILLLVFLGLLVYSEDR